MAAKLSLVKKIVNNEVINVFNLLLQTIFGGKIPGFYDENKIYNKGDIIIKQDGDNIEILVCTKDNVSGSFNEDDFKKTSFTELFGDSSILLQNNTTFNNSKEAMADDLSSILHELTGLIDSRLVLNTMYRENFKSMDFITISKGVHIPGCLESFMDDGIDFKLKECVILKTEPTKFKLRHIIELQGVPTLGCSITFNALDSNPYWFNANDALLDDGYFNIPLTEFEKEKDVPYAMNIRIFGSSPQNTSIKISDLTVVFV